MTRLAQDDIRMKNRAGLSGSPVVDDPEAADAAFFVGSEGHTAASAGVIGNVEIPPKVASIAKKMDLDAAYARYKNGKGFGRSDLFIVLIDEIKELKARIGSVDEARVSELDARMSALERTIGNALGAATPEKRGPGRPAKKTEGGE